MPEPLGRDRLAEIAHAALEEGGSGGAEALLLHEWGGLTRFAGSAIHQSTAREETMLKVRVADDGRIGIATTNDLTAEGAAAAARSALETARMSTPDPHFPGFAPREPALEPPDAYDEATAAAGPAARAEAVASAIARTDPAFRASGAYQTQGTEIAVLNTEGQACYGLTSRASISAVVSGTQGGAGFAEAAATSADEVDPAAVATTAFEKARDSESPRDIDAGIYEVILEPPAVATLIGFLSYLGFGGRALAEGRSCFSGRIGERLLADTVSIYDDALSPEGLGIGFDFEGTPKRRVDLVEDGVVIGGVHDRRSAAMAGTESTGHALPAPNTEGPLPFNLFLRPGAASRSEMIASIERGLLVTRFHYSNVVHPPEAVITGMTRDGTWLIEKGEIRHPVRNLRFTQSIIEALRDVRLIGEQTQLASEFFFEASRVPSLLISAFSFTGKSDH